MKKESVHNCVSQLRVRHNITQEELAKKVNVSRQTIIAIEKGDYVPSVLLALKISRYFKCQVEKIFSVSKKYE